MNKYILTFLTMTTFVNAGEGQGTAGEPSNNTTASTETVYQLVCTSTSEQDSTQQDSKQYCVLVPVPLDN